MYLLDLVHWVLLRWFVAKRCVLHECQWPIMIYNHDPLPEIKKGRNPEIKWRHTTSLCYGGLHVNWFALVEFSRALTEVFSRYEVNIVHFIFILICNFTKLTFDGNNFDAFSCGSSPASSEAMKQGSGLNCLIKLDAVMFFFLFWNTWNGVKI